MEAITYVVESAQLGAVKVGWTALGSSRLDQLDRHGWRLRNHLVLSSRRLAWDVEQATLFELRHRLHVPPYVLEPDMPAGGWTETSSIALINSRQLWDIVCDQAGAVQLAPTIRRTGRLNRVPPAYRRTKGDSLPHVSAARREAADTARIRQRTAPNQTPKRAIRKDES